MISKLHKLIGDCPRWILLIFIEGWPVLIIVFALMVEFSHIVSSSWLQLYLYNGDDLTLPILTHALLSRGSFLWVSSSQFLIFPEELLYLISKLLTTSVRAALVFNSGLNMAILYALLRWAAGSIDKLSRYAKQQFALGCCLLLISYMLLERQSIGSDSGSIATLFLFTTYYYGVILSGMFVLCGFLRLKHALSIRQAVRRHWLFMSITSLLVVLSTFSDPLFVVQFTLPLVVAAVVTYICNGLRLKDLLMIGIPVLISSFAGYVLRIPFKAFVGASVGTHLYTNEIPSTITVFHQAYLQYVHSLVGLVELFLVSAVIIFSLLYSLRWIHKTTRRTIKLNNLDGRLFFVSVFVYVEAFTIISFSVATGSQVTRYLVPLFVFPLLGLLPLLRLDIRRFKKPILIAFGSILLIIIVAGVASLHQANTILSSSSYSDPKCLQAALDDKPEYGVGSYWQVRALDVYGHANEQALQVSINVRPFPWQANLADYKNKQFTFIIVSKQLVGNVRELPVTSPYIPSNPVKIVSCSDIFVYIYKIGSTGYDQLNADINTEYPTLVQGRANGEFLQSL
jgi:hypothetical protein